MTSADTGSALVDTDEVDVDTMLDLLRLHLGLDVVFVGRFVADERRFEHVSTGGAGLAPPVGSAGSLADSYCTMIVDGRLAAVTFDARQHAELAELPVTDELGIRAYLGVPIRLPDGETYGTLCGYRHQPDPSLDDRDVATLAFVADVVAAQVIRQQVSEADHHVARRDIRTLLGTGGPQVALQPIVALTDGRVIGYEALARFPGDRPVPRWFELATQVGWGIPLEHAAAANALSRLAELPDDVYLSINLSPAAILAAGASELFDHQPMHRIVLELTEEQFQQDADGQRLHALLATWRHAGLRLAIDDVGRGFNDSARMIDLAPEIMKLDLSLVRGLDRNPGRQALIAGMVGVGLQVGTSLVAEGVETRAELATLRDLGVPCGQGYLFGRPAPQPVASATLLPVPSALDPV